MFQLTSKRRRERTFSSFCVLAFTIQDINPLPSQVKHSGKHRWLINDGWLRLQVNDMKLDYKQSRQPSLVKDVSHWNISHVWCCYKMISNGIKTETSDEFNFHMSPHLSCMLWLITEIFKCPSKCIFDWKCCFSASRLPRVGGVWESNLKSIKKLLVNEWWNFHIWLFDFIYGSTVGCPQQMLHMNCKFL